MTMTRRGIGRGVVGPETRTTSLSKQRYAYDSLGTEPFCWLRSDSLGAPTGATGDENLVNTGFNVFEYHILGAGQTILVPGFSATGYDWSFDQTDDEGIEVNFGGIVSSSPKSYTIGTDDDFFARLKFTIADVSGTDDCAFGFRKVEAYQANIDDYADAAFLNVISGNINIETILNGTATTTTDTTENWADAAAHELEVRVKGRVASYRIDGAPPTRNAAEFQFDAAEVLTPFFYFLHSSDVAGAVEHVAFECGLLDDRLDGTL